MKCVHGKEDTECCAGSPEAPTVLDSVALLDASQEAIHAVRSTSFMAMDQLANSRCGIARRLRKRLARLQTSDQKC